MAYSPSIAEKINFVKNLSIMMKSGIMMDEALAELAEQATSKKFRAIILAVREDIARGAPLSAAFAKHPIFESVFNALLKAGEASGTLDESLIFLADWLERESDMRKDMNSATLYPKIVIGAVIVLAAGLNLFVMPKLLPLFADMDIALPWTTRMLLASSRIARDYWYALLAGIAALWVGILILLRLPSVRTLLDSFYLRVPFFGALTVDYEMAVMSQLFYTCFKSGLPMQEAIGIVSTVMHNSVYRRSFAAISTRVQSGTSLADALRGYPRLYPRQVVSIIATGEKSGTLSESFSYLAAFYAKEVRSKTKDIPTVLEPVLLIFIALMIGFIAFSVIVPIYTLSTSVS